MLRLLRTWIVLIPTLTLFARDVGAIDVTVSALGGPTAQQAANIVVFSGNGLSAPFAANFNVRFNGEIRPSNQRAIGSFTDGLGPAAHLPLAQRLLPFPNRDLNGNGIDDPDEQVESLAYAPGGIGIQSGICLCTGRVSDFDDYSSASPPWGFGVEGPNNGDKRNLTGLFDGEATEDWGEPHPEDDDYVAVFGSVPPNPGDELPSTD